MLAKGLPKILDELNYIAGAVRKELRVGGAVNSDSDRVIVELYTYFFQLLTKIILWCEGNSKRRLWKSLKRDCYQEFKADLDMIEKWSTRISRDMHAIAATN